MLALFAPVLALFMLLVPSGGWLGVYLAADREEAVVTEVVPGSPAAKAGFKAGDIFVSVGDTATPTRAKLMAAIGKASPGDRVRIKVKRGDKHAIMVVKLGKRPSENVVAETAPPAPARKARRPGNPAAESAPAVTETVQEPAVPAGGVYLGIAVAEEDGKLMIERVLDGSPAEAARLRAGTQLATIDGRRLGSLDDLDKALGKLRVGKPVPVGMRSKNNTILVMLTPASRQAVPGRSAEAPVARAAEPEEVLEEILEEVVEQPMTRRGGRTIRSGRRSAAEATRPSPSTESRVDSELKSLRRELAELKKELQQLRKQIRRKQQ